MAEAEGKEDKGGGNEKENENVDEKQVEKIYDVGCQVSCKTSFDGQQRKSSLSLSLSLCLSLSHAYTLYPVVCMSVGISTRAFEVFLHFLLTLSFFFTITFFQNYFFRFRFSFQILRK